MHQLSLVKLLAVFQAKIQQRVIKRLIFNPSKFRLGSAIAPETLFR